MTEIKKALQKHKSFLETMGYQALPQFQKLLESGKKKDLKEYLDSLPNDTPLLKEMYQVMEYM